MRARTLLLGVILLLALPAAAQQTVKRSEVELLPVGPPKQEPSRNWGAYDTQWMFELGYQNANIHGNNEVYRSQLNYSDGFRLFNFSVTAKARDASAFWTRMHMEASGWGGDPYNWFRYGLSKDRWIDFKADYLKSDYFFDLPGFALNQHRNDQERRRQNYELTIFPQRALRFRVAYGRNSSFTGINPVLTTFDFSRDEFAMFEPLRQTYDEYTLGADWSLPHWNFFFDYSSRFMRNDRFLEVVTPPIPNPGNSTSLNSSLNFLERHYPGRGKIPSVRLTIAGRPHPTLDVSAQISYSHAKYDFTTFEVQNGRTFDPNGAPPPVPITRTLDSFGDVLRPNTLADFAITWRPVRHLSISETFRYNGFDIAGFDLTNQFDICGALTDPSACDPGFTGGRSANLFDVDYFVNRFEIRYDFTNWLGVRAGHRYLRRDTVIQHTVLECANSSLPDCTGGTPSFDEENEAATRVANVLLLGADLRPHRTFGLFVDYEWGGIDSVFARVREGHRTILRLRGRWEPTEGVKLTSTYTRFDVRAPSPDVDSNQRNHGVTVDLSLTRWQRFYLDLGYARNDVSAFTDIGRRSSGVFLLVDGPTGVDCTFVGGVWLRQVALGLPCRPSTYIDNNNYAFIDFGGRIAGNLSGEIGYRVFFATGTYLPSDPEAICPNLYFGPCQNYPTDPATGLPFRVEWGGLNYHQPHAQLRYDFSDNLAFKAGWRWYGYNLKNGTFSDYKAHLITTSLVVQF